jgi:hypothetical protein
MLDQNSIEHLAAKHAVSAAAVAILADAIESGGGSLAQFNHPELGGAGQWMRGGMLMIGDMFNDRLKARVAALCINVADAVGKMPTREGMRQDRRSEWWPAGFGIPSAVGRQNAMRYAFFPASKRLVVDDNGRISTFDTGEHVIVGVSQQQSLTQSLAFTTVKGTLDLTALPKIE